MTARAARQAVQVPRRWIPARAALWGLVVVVVAAMALDSTYRDPDDTTAGGRAAFDPERFGRENFEARIVPAIEERAVAITELMPALRDDPEAAGKRYGHREGQSPYNFAARGEGIAGEHEGALLPVRVRGLRGTTVSLQVGPAINGTAVRDVTGLIDFNQFVNQVEYADAATALNDEVKAKVLAGLDPASLEGKRVSFLGAFTFLDASLATITPVRLEVMR